MWETKILGVDLYHVLAWFWLYSFCGWIWESSYVSIRQKKLVNRGFVNGPLLTLYGTGAVMVYLILRPFEENVWALYFGGVIVATVLEYVTGVLMETIFHAHWWDYSNQKFNFQGKICLSSSIAWGFFTLGLFYILQPIAVKVVNLVSDTTGEIIVSVVTVCYLVDFGFSAAAAFQLGQKMRSLEKTWGEFLKYLQKSRFNQLAEEMNAKVQQYRAEYSRDKMKEYLAEKRQTLSEAMEQMQKLEKERKEAEGRRNPLSESKNRLMEFGAEQKERLTEFGAEQKERFAALGFDVRSDKMPDLKELLERFDQMTKPQLPTNWLMRLTTKRYLRAYPHLQGTHHASLKKEEKKALKAKNKYNRRTFRFIWIISVLIVGAMAAVYMMTGMNDLLAVNRTDSSTVKIEIPENPTVDDVTKVLVDNKVIGEPSYFKLFVNVTKSADDFTQGTYEIRRNMDYEAIINFLSSNNNRTDTVSVTITEGESVLEIANTLEKNGALGDRDEFLSLCNSEKFDSDFDFIKAETNADKRYYKLEGYLYPDTYEFYRNENAESVIYKFLNNYETKINEKQTVDGYSKKTTVLKMVEESDTKYSLDQVMTIASIIQAEAADKEDMYYISSILHNRLTADSSLGVSSLGLDSTKFYPYRSLEDVPENDRSTYKSRYDTYDRKGLPYGPICNPGMDAIIAALNPNSSDYYFFCHDSKGQAYYASTLEQQNANLEYIESYDN